MAVDFRPLPLLHNPHVQTLLGVLLNDWQPGLSCRRRLAALPDGDQLLLYDSRPSGWLTGWPIALLVHGLTGCHRSGHLVRLGRLLVRQGWRVVRLDLRGAGPGIRFARRTYTAACSDDVRFVAEQVLREAPSSPLALAGFSLGGNIVLKLAGEAADRPLPGLAAVAAVNPPVDLELCSNLLSRPANRIYNRYFARALARHALHHRQYFPDAPAVEFPADLTLFQFDELYTAPRWGYCSAVDYYRRASAEPLLERIDIPTLILTAHDDPFVAVEPIAALPRRDGLETRIVRHGGHLGFVGLDQHGTGIRWAERQVAEWLLRTIKRRRRLLG